MWSGVHEVALKRSVVTSVQNRPPIGASSIVKRCTDKEKEQDVNGQKPCDEEGALQCVDFADCDRRRILPRAMGDNLVTWEVEPPII